MVAGADEAPRRALNFAAAPSRFALMSGTQLSHCAFVVVLVSHSRATSCCLVYLSTVVVSSSTGDECALSAGEVSKARGAEEPPREWNHGTRYCGTIPSV